MSKKITTIESPVLPFTMEELDRFKQIDVKTVEREELVDLNSVTVDKSLSQQERLCKFYEDLRNPYCFKVGEVVVSVGFSNTDLNVTDALSALFRTV